MSENNDTALTLSVPRIKDVKRRHTLLTPISSPSNTDIPLNSKTSNMVATRPNMTRVYSVSSEVVPQILTHPDPEDSILNKKTKSQLDSSARWSHVGFQSIFQNPNGTGQRRSIDSFSSRESSNASSNNPNSSFRQKSVDSFDRKSHLKVANTFSNESLYTLFSNSRDRLNKRRERKNSLLSLPLSSSNNMAKGNNPANLGTEDSSYTKQNRLLKTRSTSHSLNTSGSIASSTASSTASKKKNLFLKKVTSKIFQSNKHGLSSTGVGSRGKKDKNKEQVVPNSLGKFLHSSLNKHRSPVQFIHNTTGGIIDSGKSVYSFNPSILNNTNDFALAITQLDDSSYDSTNITILHDLLKNLPSLEENYKTFSIQELHILSGNVWGIYCSIVIELFKNQRIWQLPAKIEDINRLLEFYITLKHNSKIASVSSNVKFINELEEFITTSLYVFENQIVFNYTNEETINTALKRLGIIWQVFFQQVYYDIIAVLLPLERWFELKQTSHNRHKTHNYTNHHHKGHSYLSSHGSSTSALPNVKKTVSNTSLNGDVDSNPIMSIDYLLLKCFRDSIVLPYYQNFIHSHDGASKSFQMYILSEEEENDVTEQDKMTLLQCFGILSTIHGDDRNQQIMEELLEGVRMSF
ncbi:hypothetical protein KAFR_0C04230 [Kazachstania africana CBS 2517]|uniref:Target of rapamycin complex 2 subunit BIT2 n=1 Tax=Kazachstania africana (strain ATCC 22294 / BCRC 22015 / CBS 2517 / CECT 1963 / NBRC 1671 / NRRL Y-8276) TaxID=1071382 RepID=H2ASR4_KAZAF|nr:hypothetical protein KAFR_0C04230 [Kazachstania africana CBS 2517]CCF57414.1 hypothetical protein KAFR_0C04230 [Kazachstania africana CBS 2517]